MARWWGRSRVGAPALPAHPELVGRSAALLRRLGVPTFAGRSDAWGHGRIVPLLWLVAFQLGAVTYRDELSLSELSLSSALVLMFAMLGRRVSASALGIEDTQLRWWLVPMLLVPAAGFFLVRDGVWPLTAGAPVWLYPHPWSDTAVILASLYAAAFLLLGQACGRTRAQAAALGALLVVALGGTVTFAVTYPVPWRVGEVEGHTSLPALAVAVGALVVALLLPRLQSGAEVRRPGLLNGPVAGSLLLFGLSNGLLVYEEQDIVLRAAVLYLLAVVGWISTSAVLRRPAQHLTGRLSQQVEEPRLQLWLPAFLLAYPVIGYLLYPEHVVVAFGARLSGLTLVAALMAVNVACVAVVWVLVTFGVDDVMLWALRESWANRIRTVKRLAEAAPLLLIFVAWNVFSAETWQIAHAASLQDLTLVLALFLLLALALVLGWSAHLLRRCPRFESWDQVRQQVHEFASDEDCDPSCRDVARELAAHLTCQGRPTGAPDVQRLRAPWVNALLVLAALQSFLFLPVAMSLLVAFTALVVIAVPDRTAAEWIFGDGQEDRAGELAGSSLDAILGLVVGDGAVLSSTWIRVPALLVGFSVLYLAAQLTAREDARTEYFDPMRQAIRHRLALALAHAYVSCPPDAAALQPVVALPPATAPSADGGRVRPGEAARAATPSQQRDTTPVT